MYFFGKKAGAIAIEVSVKVSAQAEKSKKCSLNGNVVIIHGKAKVIIN